MKFYPNSKYTLTADELPLTAVFLECRRIFLQSFTVGVARLQRGHNKRSKKTTTEVVILSHKLNMKVLSLCYTALLCNSVWSILALSWRSCISQSVHHSPGLKTEVWTSHVLSSGPFLGRYGWILLLLPFPFLHAGNTLLLQSSAHANRTGEWTFGLSLTVAEVQFISVDDNFTSYLCSIIKGPNFDNVVI